MTAPDTSDPAVAAAEAQLARLRADAEAAEAQLKAAQARAALAAAEAEAARAGTLPPPPAAGPAGPLSAEEVRAVIAGYTFGTATLDLGALMNGSAVPEAQIRIPLAMMNRHGLVAGATGTGKTRTLQGLAEQLAAKGVPVFAADVKGDLSGVATPGEPNEKLLERTRAIAQTWKPAASVTEYFALGGIGKGVPVRATVSAFGPLLLSLSLIHI